ncbi:YopX family protein [Neobacillus sp. 19]|uniref:YopX family protein n=1 Tax=Neobacillus sp. 19 TaxID=3394458 RepID=UPI003C2C605C
MYALDIQKMFEMDRLHLPCTTQPNPASIYMQYTGLKDKNGKEIFEGDVLKDEFGLGEVKWVQEHCSFVVYAPEKGYYFLESVDGEALISTEVIGNVFDMPDWDC